MRLDQAPHRVVLSDFREVRPLYESTQEVAIDWLASAHAVAQINSDPTADFETLRQKMIKRISRFGCAPGQINKRGHELEDFKRFVWDEMRVFKLQGRKAEGLATRQAVFAEAADRIFNRFYPNETPAPDDLIHVTCTGYIAPSAAQNLVVRRGWQQLTTVTHAYHMGCYASIPAARIAQGFIAAGRRRVDIAHTELCTLHLDTTDSSPEQLVVQSLFADGSIRYTAQRADATGKGLELLALREELIPHSAQAMQWIPADWGIRMTLSRDVPALIADSLNDYLSRLETQSGCSPQARRTAVFAIHPGGPKIIDRLQQMLELSDEQIRLSRDVLRDCGNMSSSTLPHIWSRILDDPKVASGTLVYSMAFGPGLTIAGGLMQKV